MNVDQGAENILAKSFVIDNRPKELDHLLKHTSNVDLGFYDTSVFLRACEDPPRIECLKVILDHGANPNAIHPFGGFTPLMKLCLNDLTEAACLLIERKADVFAMDDVGTTALEYAMANSSSGSFHVLIQAGALSKTRGNGRRLLECAIRCGTSVDMCEVLYDQGCRRGTKEMYPTWFVHYIIGKRNKFKKAYATLYGIIRRRVEAGKDMTRMISSMLYSMRFDEKWLKIKDL